MGILFPKIGIHTVKTKTPGSYINGVWVDGIETEIPFTADIQPISGIELDTLNIGTKNIGKIKIYTNTSLKIKEDGQNQNGDIVVWNGDGNKYEIVGELNYDNGIIPHRKYVGELRINTI